MHRIQTLFAALVVAALLAPVAGRAQCDLTAEDCILALFPFKDDGQFYRAELFPGESARVRITFYSGMVYRLAPCAQGRNNRLIMTVRDLRGNVLFTNEGKSAQDYWDFAFAATATYNISVRFENRNAKGCAALLVGYLEADRAQAVLDYPPLNADENSIDENQLQQQLNQEQENELEEGIEG